VPSSFVFMKRMSQSVHIQYFTTHNGNGEQLLDEERLNLPKGIILYEINGPLFFGAARQFQETIINTHLRPKVIIIRMRYVPLIDVTGYQSLKEIIKTYKTRNVRVIISGVKPSLRKDFKKNGIFEILDNDSVVEEINMAIEQAKVIMVGGVS